MAMHDLRATFTKGEVSPLVHAREDLTLYKQALATLRNFIGMKQGGIRRRSGTRYYGATKATTTTELLPFIFNDEQSYALEFGHNYIRFWTPNGLVLKAGVPYEIASPYTAAQVSRIQWAQSNDVLYLAHPDVAPKQLNRFADDDWTVTDVDFKEGPFLPLNDTDNTVNWTTSPVLGASTTFTHATTAGINGGAGFKSTDVGRHYRVQSLGVFVWGVITSVTNDKTIIVSIKNSSFVGTSAATSWTKVTGDEFAGNTVQENGNNPHGLTAADVGKILRAQSLVYGDDWYVRITRIIGNNSLSMSLIGVVTTGARNSATFQLGAFSDTTGYPGSVAFFGGRLCWARTRANPRGVALSVSGVPTAYTPSARDGTVTDEHGMWLDVTAGLSDEFHWIADGARLIIGSPSSVRSIGSADSNAVLSPKTAQAKLELPVGSSAVLPVQVGGITFHGKRMGQGVIALAYDYNAGGIVGPEQSILSEHLYHSGIRRMTYSESPEGVVWILAGNGVLTGMTHDRYEEVAGFHTHPMQNADVQSILSIPSRAHNRDMLFLIIKRVINGSTVQYVEVLEKPFYDADKKDAFFVDCGATYTGAPTGTVTGLGFLEGQTVSLLVDGAVLPNVVVQSGVVTIPNGIKGSVIHVGLAIDARVTLLPVAAATQEGNQRGISKRIVYLILDLLETRGGKVGIEGFELEDIMHRLPTNPMGQGLPLFTGTTDKITIEDTHDSSNQLTVVCEQPLPMTIRAINVGIEARP